MSVPFVPQTNTAAGTATGNLQNEGPADVCINSPELSVKTLKPKVRAVTDIDHVFLMIGNLQQARRIQNEKNGRIQAKLNSERPYSDESLKAEGLGYKSNFSTKPLSTTVGKVAARLTKSIQAARYLTSSELPESFPGARQKTELFRKEITDCIRSWPGWYPFLNDVAAEDSTFGWTTVTWFDHTSWKPTHYRQDRAFLPDGTKQSVDSMQFGAFLQYVSPHELLDFIRDKQAAEDAGWDIENTVDAINTARPPTIPSPASAPYTDFRRYEDLIRESGASLTVLNGAKQVMLWHLLAVEIDGKVSYYIGDGNSKKLLYEGLDRFESVEDCVAFLSYEQANGTLMGSKGIGRDVYELSNIVDRARNEAVDRLQMSGKIIVSGPENQINRFKLTVLGNVIIIPDGFELHQNKIESDVSDFVQLDQLLTQLLDQIAGGVTPREFTGDRVTKAEVDLFASREEEKRDDIISRFVQHIGSVVSTIQRRICSPNVEDRDAKQRQKKLLGYMSSEELKYLAEQPALQTVEDYTQSEAQRMVAYAQEKRNDPLYDHPKMERMATAAAFDADFADAVILPDNDPTQQAEQTRLQLFECDLLRQGIPIPVSPRDGHEIHIATLKNVFAIVAKQAAQLDPASIQAAEQFVTHWGDHLEFLIQAGGADKKQLAPEIQELKTVAQQIGHLKAQAQHAQALAAQGAHPAVAAASAMSVSPPGPDPTPPQQGGPTPAPPGA
jgi:hypothetical protein